MALELEETIMAEIGLGQHYNYFNGSGSCYYIRTKAANQLESVIRKHHKAGEKIAAPNMKLIQAVQEVARDGDEDNYVLTKTWQAASYAIAAHIHAAHGDAKTLKETEKYIRDNYLPKRPPFDMLDDGTILWNKRKDKPWWK